MTGVTIGEVLNRLKEEFPDITISKIRFLDAEGLIVPDRTPAGYRQFTDADIERLRYVLRAQYHRDLRLATIREELRRLDAGEDPLDVVTGAAAVMDAVGGVVPEAQDSTHGDEPGRPAPPVPTRPVSADRSPRNTAGALGGDLHLSGRELAEAAGLELREVRSLQEHGLLPPGDVFDGDGLSAAKAAAGLLEAGLEARHLRMYRQFADREVSLHQQLVQPILRQRNPQARQRASELLDQLAEHGTELHAALLRRELREMLRS